MKKDPEIELEIQAWVDGELSPDAERRLTDRLRDNPQLQHLADHLSSLTRLLREEAPTPPVPVSKEFYWTGIRRGIEASGDPRPAQSAAASGHRSPLGHWWAWLIPTGAVALAVALLLPSANQTPGSIPVSRQALTDHLVETPSDEVSSLTFYAAQDGMTIVWLGKIDFL